MRKRYYFKWDSQEGPLRMKKVFNKDLNKMGKQAVQQQSYQICYMQKKKSQFSSKILATSKFIPQIIGEPTICKIQIVLIAHFSKIQLFYFSSRSKKYVQFQNLFFMILHRENVLKTCHLSLDRCFLKHKKPVLKWIGVFSLTASP